MADDVTYTAGANATPPDTTVAATDETTAGPHSAGSHMGIAKLAISADGDSTHIPATVADGLRVEVSNAGAITFGGLTDAELRAAPVPIADGAGSLTVDAPVGTPVNVQIGDALDVANVTGAGELSVIASAQPGVDIGDVTVNNGAGAAAVNIQDGGNTITVDGTVTVGALPNEGQQTMANSISVAVASDQSNLPTKETRSGTAATSQVADNAANQTLLAANANRLGATIQNDSSAALYVKLGTTATTSDYTVRLTQYAYYEVPFNYTGRIDGIWASDPNDGAARITELT